jgi:hypothetical protein
VTKLEKSNEISLSTNTLRLSIDKTGKVTEFTDVTTGVNWAEQSSYFAYLLPGTKDTDENNQQSDRMKLPTQVLYDAPYLKIYFDNPSLTFILLVEEKETNIRLTVVDAPIHTDIDYGRFVFGACVLRDKDGKAPFSGTVVPMHMKCNLLELPGHCTRLGAVGYSRLSAQGIGAAVIGVPANQLRQAIKEAMAHLSLDDVILSPYGGAFGNDAPGVFEDYIIDSAYPEETNRWLDPMEKANIKLLSFHQGWLYRQGDFRFKESFFPEDVFDFKKKVSDELHKRRIRAGFHTYSAMLNEESEFVTPVPHPDLAVIGTYTLAHDIDESTDTIYIKEDTGSIPMEQGHAQIEAPPYHCCLVIDNEIIEFQGKGENNSLTDCIRGRFNTKISSHKAGAQVKHLKRVYEQFHAIPGSMLFNEIAYRTALAYNRGDFDSIYFDGFEAISFCCDDHEETEGLGWYYKGIFVREVLRYCKRTPLIEYSSTPPTLWLARSRMGAWDVPSSGFKHFIDKHCEYNELNAHRRLLTSQLGWFLLYPPVRALNFYPNWCKKILYMDDVDYLCTKSIAFRSHMSWQSVNPKTLEKFPVLERYLNHAAWYSRVRESVEFNPELLERLKAANCGHKMIEENGKYGFMQFERLYFKPYSLYNGENTTKGNNPFSPQKPVVRLEIQHTAVDYNDPRAITLAKYDREVPVAVQSCHLDLTESPVDISGCEALGVWVHGNGSNDYLNIQIQGAPPSQGAGVGDHVIHLDFHGWRYFTLCEHDNGEYEDIDFNYDEEDKIMLTDPHLRHRRPLSFDRIGHVRILFSGDSNDVYISDIRALPVSKDPVVNPAVSDGKNTLSFLGKIALSGTAFSRLYIRIRSTIETNSPAHEYKGFKMGYLQYGRPAGRYHYKEDFPIIILNGRVYVRYFEEFQATVVLYTMAPSWNTINEVDNEILSKAVIGFH